MNKYEHTHGDFSPEDALKLALKARSNKEMRRIGVSLAGTPDAVSLLYHATKYVGLKIINAEIDGEISQVTPDIAAKREMEWNMFIQKRDKSIFRRFQSNTSRPQAALPPASKAPAHTARKGVSNPMKELDSLIGLSSVKEQVRDMAAFAKNNQQRKRKGLPPLVTSQHMVFTGNPGTGKTTVARIVGEIYRELGLLSKGHFTEIGGRDLIAEYIGQTTGKVREIVSEALDGILFIDEAYALVPTDSSKDFGPEALAALIKLMDDNRDRLIVIMAGYGDEMDIMLKTNPGLQSRMKTRIRFPDYKADELGMIFELQCNQQEYLLTHDARMKASTLFAQMHAARDEHFGNGRAVRNAFERCAVKQARRLVEKRAPSKRDLQTFFANDIPALDELDW